MTKSKLLVFLMGPTASGKTDFAAKLAKALPVELISVDSALVYTGLDIGTSKPDDKFLQATPHRLIDIRDPAEVYSAAEFRHDALDEIEEIFSNGNTPLLVGGTMLYFRALEHGLSNLPSADETLRGQLYKQLKADGLESLYEKLLEVDPESAERINANDTQRILRSLEIFILTGKPQSQWWREQEKSRIPYRVVKIALCPEERSVLHERIEKRFDQMLEQGFVEEVEALYRRGDLHIQLPAIRSVGYRQVWQYLSGELSYKQMRDRGVVATRQLAKRQLTWLRSDPEINWFDPMKEESLQKVIDLIQLQLNADLS